MGRRKGWDDLTPAYRRRLERSGITRRSYGAGASLSAARGHRTTPERPSQAERHPERYSEYRSRRNLQRVLRELRKSKLAPDDYELDVLKEQFGTSGVHAILEGQLKAHRDFQRHHGDPGYGNPWFHHDGPELMEHYSDGEVDISQYMKQLYYHGTVAA